MATKVYSLEAELLEQLLLLLTEPEQSLIDFFLDRHGLELPTVDGRARHLGVVGGGVLHIGWRPRAVALELVLALVRVVEEIVVHNEQYILYRGYRLWALLWGLAAWLLSTCQSGNWGIGLRRQLYVWRNES